MVDRNLKIIGKIAFKSSLKRYFIFKLKLKSKMLEKEFKLKPFRAFSPEESKFYRMKLALKIKEAFE